MEVMAERTERRLTRDLMLLAVPWIASQRVCLLGEDRAMRTNSSANILAARETWSLGAVVPVR